MFLLLEEKLEKLLPLQEPRKPTFQLRDLSKRLSAHAASSESLVCQTTNVSEPSQKLTLTLG
jgi:hypothetical protein